MNNDLEEFLIVVKENDEVFEELRKAKRKCLHGMILQENQGEYLHRKMKNLIAKQGLDISITSAATGALDKMPVDEKEVKQAFGEKCNFGKKTIALFALLSLGTSTSFLKQPIQALVPESAYTEQVSQRFIDLAAIQNVNAQFEEILKQDDLTALEKAICQLEICNKIRESDKSFDFMLTSLFEGIDFTTFTSGDMHQFQRYLNMDANMLTWPDRIKIFNEKVFFKLPRRFQVDLRPYDQKRKILTDSDDMKIAWPIQEGFELDQNKKAIKRKLDVIRTGEKIDRYGTPYGDFVCPMKENGESYEYEKRILPYINNPLSYHKYEVKKDISAKSIFKALKDYEDERFVQDVLQRHFRKSTLNEVTESDFEMYSGKIQPAFGYEVPKGEEGVQIKLPVALNVLICLGFVEEIEIPDKYKDSIETKAILERDTSKDESIDESKITTISELKETLDNVGLSMQYINLYVDGIIGENEVGVRKVKGGWFTYNSGDKGVFWERAHHIIEADACRYALNMVLEEDSRRRRTLKHQS